jgi:hypothetical protein
VADEEISVTWVVVMVMIGIAAFGWGFLAGSYAGAHSSTLSRMSADSNDDNTRSLRRVQRRAVATFVGHAIEQLPNLPAVISWHFSNRIWLPIMIIVFEVGALIGAYALKKVETALKTPKQRGRQV